MTRTLLSVPSSRYLVRLRVHIDNTTGAIVAKWSEEVTNGVRTTREYHSDTFTSLAVMGTALQDRFS